MTATRSTVSLPVVVLLSVIVTLVAHDAFARRQAPAVAAIEPARIGTVDLERVFEQIDAKRDADAQFQALSEELAEKNRETRNAIEAMEADLEFLTPGGDKHRELQEQIAKMTFQYRARVDVGNERLNRQSALMLKSLYGQIKRAAAEVAGADLDLILVNDSLVPLLDGTEAEMSRQISARRMIFAHEAIDVTDAIIEHMNR